MGGHYFMTDVMEGDNKVREIAANLRKTVSPARYATVLELGESTPQISAAEWKAAIDKCIPGGFPSDELIYIQTVETLDMINLFMGEYKYNTTRAVNWLTMMVHAFFFSASSKVYIINSGLKALKCASYLMTIAPFSLNALFAQRQVSTDELDVALHIKKLILAQGDKLFNYVNAQAAKGLHDHMKRVKVVLGVPEELYSPLEMERHYSYLPVFKKPFITSLLDAYEAKAEHDLFNLRMSMFNPSDISESRWRLQHQIESAISEGFYLGPRATYVPQYSVAYVPPTALALAYLGMNESVLAWSGIGRIIAEQIMRAFYL